MDGYDQNFADAMILEKQVTDSYNENVSSETVEQRRLSVIERGRSLKK